MSYIAFKIPHDYDIVTSTLDSTDISQILFMPVIQPKTNSSALKRALNFVNSWNNKAGNRVLAYETNFKTETSPYLQPFVIDGIHYQNLLHYVNYQTGLRPGCYPEEPMGPRGIVTRWADWLIKDLGNDMRGDHYKLMSIPYGKNNGFNYRQARCLGTNQCNV